MYRPKFLSDIVKQVKEISFSRVCGVACLRLERDSLTGKVLVRKSEPPPYAFVILAFDYIRSRLDRVLKVLRLFARIRCISYISGRSSRQWANSSDTSSDTSERVMNLRLKTFPLITITT